MKKFAEIYSVILCGVLLICLCSCTRDTSGYSYELTSARWSAVLSGGAEVNLKFDGEIAHLSVKSGDETAEIEGSFVSDDKIFIIYDDELSQTYEFSYAVRGEKLDLTYDGGTITLER